MSEFIDAMGKQCPLPVVMTKKKITEMGSGEVVVAVDNEIAVSNLEKLARSGGYQFSSCAKEPGRFEVTLKFDQVSKAAGNEEEYVSCQVPAQAPGNQYVVVVSSDQMGVGDEAFGRGLLKGFIFALTSQDKLPETILFYNKGVFLTTEGSDSLADLKGLEEAGVKIMSCGACLNQYERTELLRVGSITNMYEICRIMTEAGKVVKPC